MDRFVKAFIILSIVYLGAASMIGVCMIAKPELINLKFVHSHLMMLGWVSMMIYGVGYHILPRFSGKPLKSRMVAEVQLWLANIGLIGLTSFYVMGNKTVAAAFGLLEAAAIMLFLYNMLATLLAKEPQA
jgi:cbb3-type cytochrome oxidase subunit 1